MFAFYSFESSFGNSMSRPGLRGCLFVPAAFASTRGCSGERATTENWNEELQPDLLGLQVGGRLPAGSEQACPLHFLPREQNRDWLVHWPTFPATQGALLGYLTATRRPLRGTELLAMEPQLLKWPGSEGSCANPSVG